MEKKVAVSRCRAWRVAVTSGEIQIGSPFYRMSQMRAFYGNNTTRIEVDTLPHRARVLC